MRAKSVLQYLRDNPKFLRANQAELTRLLRLAERDVVDLTGRQLAALRDENTALRKQLGVWYQNAADNEQIMLFLHRLAVELAGGSGTLQGTAKKLAAQMKKILGVPLCRIVPLVGNGGMALSPADRRALIACGGALRAGAPLASLKGALGTRRWKVWLHVPVYKSRALRACIVCASDAARQFPRTAHADYAVRMADMVGRAL